MKKIAFLFIASFFFLFGHELSAQQTKFGHLDYAEVMKVMPGIDTAQANIQAFQEELIAVRDGMTAEFQKKQGELERSAASANTSQAVLKIKQDELVKLYERIQTFNASIEADLTNKQVELLQPFQDKLKAVIEEVAKEGKYTYIFDVQTLSFSTESTDITVLVKEKLQIK